MQLSQEQALDRKISSFQETITLLQERYNQEIKALQGITVSQQEETTATRVAITNLQHSSDKHDERDEEIRLLQETVKSLQTLAKKVEADNTKLQHEVVELRAQLSHAEDSLMKAGMRSVLACPYSVDRTDFNSRNFSYPTSEGAISSSP